MRIYAKNAIFARKEVKPRFSWKSCISSAETPYILYNGKRYDMHPEGGDIWCSAPLDLAAGVDKGQIVIEDYPHAFKVKLNLGIEEDDLF